MQNEELDKTKDLCARLLMAWFIAEKNKPDMTYSPADEEFMTKSFTARILSKKLEMFNMSIHIPAYLYMLIAVCCDENPGQAQLILKTLLNSIKNNKGLIEAGYIIRTEDFVNCFANRFPIMAIPDISDEYRKLWEAQKRQPKDPFLESDNKCDTPEWWLEVMA